jgi:hypothetical protein
VKLVKESLNEIELDEGLFGKRKTRPEYDFNEIADLVDLVEDKGNLSRDAAIAVIEYNKDLIIDMILKKFNKREIFKELKNKNRL